MSRVPVVGSKTCRRCATEKHVTEFRMFRVDGRKDRAYRKSWCRDCERDYARQWRKRNPTYHADKYRRYRAM